MRIPRGQTRGATFEQHDPEAQGLVNAHFEAASAFWTQVYEGDDVVGLICQRRRDIALAWIDGLHLPVHSRILEVGCGGGLLAVELASRGFEVNAIDTVDEMLKLTRQHAEQANVSTRVRTALGDVHALDFDADTFDLVIALGVMPWLYSPRTALRDIVRVSKPTAHVIVSANNSGRLTYLLDPRYHPASRPLRKFVKRCLIRLGARSRQDAAPARLHSVREFDRLLCGAGLQPVKSLTVGFGPFTFLARRLMPTRLEARLHQWIQIRAERDTPGIRSRGTQYLVLARMASAE